MIPVPGRCGMAHKHDTVHPMTTHDQRQKRRLVTGPPAAGQGYQPRWVAGVVVLAVLGSSALGLLVLRWGNQAPAYPAYQFFEPDPGLVLLRFPEADTVRSEMDWIGGRETLAVRVVEGGQERLAMVDLARRRVSLVEEPPAPASLKPSDFFTTTYVPKVPLGSRLRGRLLLTEAVETVPGAPCMRLMAQPWNAARPDPAPLFVWDPVGGQTDASQCCLDPCLGAEINPADGTTVCLTLATREPPVRQYLVERDTDLQHLGEVSPCITTPGEAILAVRYSPDGSRIAYVRARADGGTELWVVRPGNEEVGGIKLIEGDAIGASSFAFGPDSRCIAVSLPVQGQRERALKVIDFSGETPEVVDLGPGRISRAPWHPNGEFMLALVEDDTGRDELWVVYTEPPYERTRLTDPALGGEASPDREERPAGPVVSRDGRWAVGRLAPESPNTIVFIRLDRLMREPLPSEASPPAPSSPERTGRPG